MWNALSCFALAAVDSPCLTDVEQGGEDNSTVDLEFGLKAEPSTLPDRAGCMVTLLGYKVMNQFPQRFNQSDLMNNSRASLTSVQTLFSSVDLCSVLHLGH